MKQALLDTNFILTCIKQKIDFFEELPLMGIQIVIPEEVIKELEKLNQNSALKLLENEEERFLKVTLDGKNVDNAIVNFAKKNKEMIIGTLDQDIRKKIKNRKINIRNKKKLEIL